MSFRLKTILGIALIEVSLLAILVVSGLFYLRSSSETELLSRAHVTARLIATMTSDAVLSMDLATLDALVAQTLQNEGVVYIRVLSANDVVMSEGGAPEALAAAFEADATIANAENDKRLDVTAPIEVAGETFGHVEIGLSTDHLDKVLAEAQRWMLTIAGSEILIVGIFGLILGTVLTRQLAKLRDAARRVASGEFGYQLDVHGRDELADTTKSFNRMSAELAEFARNAEEARQRAEDGRAHAETVLNDAMDSMPQGVLIVDADQNVSFINHSFRTHYADAAHVMVGTPVFADIAAATLAPMEDVGGEPRPFALEDRLERLRDAENHPSWRTRLEDGRVMITTQQRMSNGGVVVVEQDVTELYDALQRNRQLELELLQTQKMEALGTMASGIAHEINTPIQYVGDNLRFLGEALADIQDTIDACTSEKENVEKVLREKLDELDWDFVREEWPDAVSAAQAGVTTVADIVRSIKEFAHPDADKMNVQDLRAVIENTIAVSRNQWKLRADVNSRFEGDLSEVPCVAGKLSQVLINLIVNAADAIEEQETGEKGRISIDARNIGEAVEIAVADNGPGIPPDTLEKVFDLFFTTKPPGKGTGQGLAICQRIVEVNHGGKLNVRSTPGEGTCFSITLPLKAAA
ncbi:MAG: ATP-binding protein [Pseudomonadota bacterium]